MNVCDCSYDDVENFDLQYVTKRKARKSHICCECKDEIKKGEQYEHVKTLQSHTWFEDKTCIPCTRVRNDFCSGGYYYGELRETLKECLGFDYVTGEEKWLT